MCKMWSVFFDNDVCSEKCEIINIYQYVEENQYNEVVIIVSVDWEATLHAQVSAERAMKNLKQVCEWE